MTQPYDRDKSIYEAGRAAGMQERAPVDMEPVAEIDVYVDDGGPCLTFSPKWYGHLNNGKHLLFTATQLQQAVAAARLQGAAQAKVPLTANDVWHNDDMMTFNSEIQLGMDDWMRLVRLVEAAHGITGKQA